MYFFYVDESGSDHPDVTGSAGHIFVLCGVSLFDGRWHRFENQINREKRRLLDRIYRQTNVRLELADCEIKSNWVRMPGERASHPFLRHLDAEDLKGLIDTYYSRLTEHHMRVFAVVADKRHLHSYMDRQKLHRKAWELLLERFQDYLASEHPNHLGVLVKDDKSLQENRNLAMKHAYIMEEGTASGKRLRHIVEMPLFVRSELSNGVQLADLIGYNIFRVFRDESDEYPFFRKIADSIWVSKATGDHVWDGLWVFPGNSPLRQFRDELRKKRAGLK